MTAYINDKYRDDSTLTLQNINTLLRRVQLLEKESKEIKTIINAIGETLMLKQMEDDREFKNVLVNIIKTHDVIKFIKFRRRTRSLQSASASDDGAGERAEQETG